MTRKLTSFRVAAFPQELFPRPWDLDQRWVHFWAQARGPIRLLSLGHPFDLRAVAERLYEQRNLLVARTTALAPLVEAVQRWDATTTAEHLWDIVNTLPSDLQTEIRQSIGRHDADPHAWETLINDWGAAMWRVAWLEKYAQNATARATSMDTWSLHHYLLALLPAPSAVDTLTRTAGRIFDTEVTEAPLPSILAGSYLEERDHLRPARAGERWWTFLQAYAIQGEWTTDTLHGVLELGEDLAVCIDTDVIPYGRAEWTTELARQRAIKEGDKRAQRIREAADDFQEVLGREQLHEIRIVIGIAGKDQADLGDKVELVQNAVAGKLKLVRVDGAQAELAKFFTPTPTSEIGAPLPPFQLPSMAAAQMIPFGVKKPDATDGVEWLRDDQNVPILLQPFQPRQAVHLAAFGQTGKGKTTTVWCLLTRLMVQYGVQVVVLEPQGHSKRLMWATGERGGQSYLLSMRERVNILDSILTVDEDGRMQSFSEQSKHVQTQLSILLGDEEASGDDDVIVHPRVFSPMERGALDQAVQRVYHGLDLLHLRREDTPTLTDLVRCLGEVADEFAHRPAIAAAAAQLRDEIEFDVVRSSRGTTYVGTTTIDWNFSHQCTGYDFSKIAKGVDRQFFYAQAFAAINRYVRSAERDRRVPFICVVDEFRNMARTPAVTEFARLAATSWRTFNGHIWIMDQTARTCLGTPGGTVNEAAKSLFQNAQVKLLLQQDPELAEQLVEAIPGLRPHHAAKIAQFRRGEALLWWRPAEGRLPFIAIGSVERTDDEKRLYEGM